MSIVGAAIEGPAKPKNKNADSKAIKAERFIAPISALRFMVFFSRSWVLTSVAGIADAAMQFNERAAWSKNKPPHPPFVKTTLGIWAGPHVAKLMA